MLSTAWKVVMGGVVCALGVTAWGQTPSERLKDPTRLDERAPERFRARFDTSQGMFVIAVEREWAPLAADRFYNLVVNGFYDDARFFRVLNGFMAQFGLHADPAVSAAWRSANLRDEPVTKSNTRGFVSFTRESGPNSRYTMIFINYKDNSYLDADGFAPFGEVVVGMDVVDKLFSGYGRQNIPDQRRILREGNAYLLSEYPRLDFIKRASIDAQDPPLRGDAEGTPPTSRAARRSTGASVYNVVSYILRVNGFPEGSEALGWARESLDRVEIERPRASAN